MESCAQRRAVRLLRSGLLALLLTGLCAQAAEQETLTGPGSSPTDPLWEVYLAGFTRYGSIYPGSSDTQVNIVPLPFPRYRGKFIRIGEETQSPLRGRVFRRDRVKLDIDFDINFGADSEDIDVRRGMSDLDLLIEVGPELSLQFIDHRPSRWRAFLNLPLRAAFAWPGFDPRYQGIVFAPELRFRKRFATDRPDEVTFLVSPSFASSDYMSYFYGVAPEFATGQRSAFDAGSGYLGTEIGVTVRRRLASRYEVVAGARLGFHQGATNNDSPLFVDDISGSIYFAMLWRFWESKRQVPRED